MNRYARIVGGAGVAVLAAAAAAHLSCAGCARRGGERGKVAVTVFPLYDLARRLADDRLDVKLVLSPGLDVHGYEPKPKDVATLADAELIFAVGLGLDSWAQGLARSAGAGDARVFEIGPLMDPILAPPGLIRDQPFIDAHFWLDPIRAQRAVDVLVEALGGLDPRGGPFYRSRGLELKQSIRALHEEIARRAAVWRRHRIVTFHGSLFYFASRYGLEVVGVVEPTPEQEPTAHHLAEILDLLRDDEPAVLLAEPQLDPALARALAREAGVTLYTVDPIGGEPGTDSYEALIRRLVATLDGALS